MSPITVNSAPERVRFAQQSLRSVVEKWLRPTLAAPARVSGFSRMAIGGTRFARVEVPRQDRRISFLFFRQVECVSASDTASDDEILLNDTYADQALRQPSFERVSDESVCQCSPVPTWGMHLDAR